MGPGRIFLLFCKFARKKKISTYIGQWTVGITLNCQILNGYYIHATLLEYVFQEHTQIDQLFLMLLPTFLQLLYVAWLYGENVTYHLLPS